MIVSSFLAISEKSVLVELWEYILENYLTPKYGNYVNISIDPDPAITPAMLFFAIFIAIMAACAMTVFNRRTLGRPVRALLKNDAVGRENAKTFDELGLKKSRLMKLFINRLTLMKAIRCVEEDEFYGIEAEEESDGEEREAEADSDGDLSFKEYKKKMKREKREASRHLSRAKLEEIGSRSRSAYYVGASSRVKYKRNIETDRFYIEKDMQYRAAVRFSSKGSNPIMLLFIAIGYVIVGVLVIKFVPYLLKFIDGTIGSFK